MCSGFVVPSSSLGQNKQRVISIANAWVTRVPCLTVLLFYFLHKAELVRQIDGMALKSASQQLRVHFPARLHVDRPKLPRRGTMCRLFQAPNSYV